MSSSIRSAAALAWCAVAASPAGAQTASPARPASAASAALSSEAPAAVPTYRSAFDGFRGFAAQPVGSWRGANDVVGRVGGWKSYAREAQSGAGQGGSAAASHGAAGHGGMAMQPIEKAAAVQPAASSPAPAAAPATGHAGHKMP